MNTDRRGNVVPTEAANRVGVWARWYRRSFVHQGGRFRVMCVRVLAFLSFLRFDESHAMVFTEMVHGKQDLGVPFFPLAPAEPGGGGCSGRRARPQDL